MDPNSKDKISIDLSIDGRETFRKRSLRKSRTFSAIASSSFNQSRSTDMLHSMEEIDAVKTDVDG